jgi:septal ring factor EnvC (AmiA/AmiB activator)
MKFISMFVLAFCLTFAQRSQGYTDADIQTLQKLVALTTAKIEDLTRQNATQEKTIQDLTSRFAEFSQKYAELSQQKDQLAFERNVFSSTATFKESSVAGLYHVYQLSPSRVFYPSNYHTHCSGNLCQTYSPTGPICNWPYN